MPDTPIDFSDVALPAQRPPANGQGGDFVSKVRQRAAEMEVPDPLVRGILGEETGGSHFDASGRVKTGPPIPGKDPRWRAIGGLQVMPDQPGGHTRTVAGRTYDLNDEGQNIEAGLAYAKEGLDRANGDPKGAAIYYFAGPKNLNRYLRTGRVPAGSDGYTSISDYVKDTAGGRAALPGSTPPVNFSDVAQPSAGAVDFSDIAQTAQLPSQQQGAQPTTPTTQPSQQPAPLPAYSSPQTTPQAAESFVTPTKLPSYMATGEIAPTAQTQNPAAFVAPADAPRFGSPVVSAPPAPQGASPELWSQAAATTPDEQGQAAANAQVQTALNRVDAQGDATRQARLAAAQKRHAALVARENQLRAQLKRAQAGFEYEQGLGPESSFKFSQPQGSGDFQFGGVQPLWETDPEARKLVEARRQAQAYKSQLDAVLNRRRAVEGTLSRLQAAQAEAEQLPNRQRDIEHDPTALSIRTPQGDVALSDIASRTAQAAGGALGQSASNYLQESGQVRAGNAANFDAAAAGQGGSEEAQQFAAMMSPAARDEAVSAQTDDEMRRRSDERARVSKIESSLTPDDRKVIEEGARSLTNAPYWYRPVKEGLRTSVGEGVSNLVAGATRTLQDVADALPAPIKNAYDAYNRATGGMTAGEASDRLSKNVYMLQSAIDEAEKRKPTGAAQKVIAYGTNLLGNLGLMVAGSETLGPEAAFAGMGFFGAKGQGAGYGKATLEAVKGLGTAKLFEWTEGQPVAARVPTVFGASYAMEKATGADDRTALSSAASNAAFVAAPAALRALGRSLGVTPQAEAEGLAGYNVTRPFVVEEEGGKTFVVSPPSPEAEQVGKRFSVTVSDRSNTPSGARRYKVDRETADAFVVGGEHAGDEAGRDYLWRRMMGVVSGSGSSPDVPHERVTPAGALQPEGEDHHSNRQPRDDAGQFVEGQPAPIKPEGSDRGAVVMAASGGGPEAPHRPESDTRIDEFTDSAIRNPQSAQPPVPETPETLRAQFKSANDPRSPRVAVLTTPGARLNNAPKGFTPLDLPEGRLFVNGDKARSLGLDTPEKLSAYVTQNGFESLIGKVAPVGDTSKGMALRTEDAEGNELSTSIVPTPQAARAQGEVDRAQFPQAASQQIMPAQDAAAQRNEEVADVEPQTAPPAPARQSGGDVGARENGQGRVAAGGSQGGVREKGISHDAGVATNQTSREAATDRGGGLPLAPETSDVRPGAQARDAVPGATAAAASAAFAAGEGAQAQAGSKTEAPREYQHSDFGHVVESDDQKGVPRGSVRVADEDGAEHIILEPKGNGRGNERAVRLRRQGIVIKPREGVASFAPSNEAGKPATTGAQAQGQNAAGASTAQPAAETNRAEAPERTGESNGKEEAAGVARGQVRQGQGRGAVEKTDARGAEEEGDEPRQEVRLEKGWERFPEHLGSLDIPRASMPQIKSEHRGAMVQFLKGRGISHTQEEVKPSTLKPSQAEYSPAKVERARHFEGPNRSLLVSSDNHVADGHHQWLAAVKDRPDEPYPVIRLNAPVKSLLLEMARFPSSGVDEASKGGTVSPAKGEGAARAHGPEAKAEEPAKAPAPRQSVSDIFDQEFSDLFGAPKGEAQSLADVARGLNSIFGDRPLKMARAEEFDEAKYSQARPLFEAGIRHAGADASDVRSAVRALLTSLRDRHGMSADVIQRMKPYVVRFIEESEANNETDSGVKSVDAKVAPVDNADNADREVTHRDGQGGDEGSRAADVRGASEVEPPARSGETKGKGRARSPRRDGGEGPRRVGDLEGRTPDPDSATGEPQPPRGGNRDSAGDRVPERRGNDYIAPAGGLERSGSWRETARRNLDILELVKRLESENRLATPEEQEQLSKFTGWGASEIANNLFPGVTRYGEIRPDMARDGWEELARRAAALFTPEELKTAARSTQYAHYTSEKVVRAIWSGLARAGFAHGRILEPGMGVGHFFTAAPADVSTRSGYTGVEMDHMTARVAKQLLQNQAVLEADYVKQKLPDNFFDVAIGNPPFAKTVIEEDPRYRKLRFPLHDFFFAKTIDKVRPGGLLVFVTSRYTMDKADAKTRDYINERADLLGAIRLPQTAFKQNAGTEVVTDVLFLRKRAAGEAPAGEGWLGLDNVTAKNDRGEDVSGLVNEYFVRHPEMVLGSHSFTGSMYRENEYTVAPKSGDIEEQFAEAVRNLPSGVYAEQAKSEAKVAEARERDWNPTTRKEGNLYVHSDGTLMRVENGSGVALKDVERLPGAHERWLKEYVPLRDALKQAQYDQLNDGEWERSLAALNKAYDSFTRKHGRVLEYTTFEREKTDPDGNVTVEQRRRYKNNRLLLMDIESPLVVALEQIDEDGEIVKGPMLLRRTVKRPEPPQIRTLSDALAVSLDQTGSLNLDHVAKLVTDAGTPMTREEVIRDLGDAVFEVPGGDWQMRDEYLSGFVIQKLEEAEAASHIDRRYERNVKALLEVQPKPLLPAQIQIGLGATWVPAEHVTRFGRDVLGVPGEVAYNPDANYWSVQGAFGPGSQSQRSAAKDWGTARRSPQELFEAALGNRSLKIYDEWRDSSGNHRQLNQTETVAANEKIKKIREEFSRWAWQDSERAADLSARYNRQYNNIVPRSFDGKHLTLPGLSFKYELHDHQKRAVWRILQTGNTYLAHAVGAGKTLEMIVSAMEQKRLGLINKPLFAVPGHMLKQFSSEFLDAYPTANILVADEESFKKENRRRFVAQAALNDLDAVVMTHSSFGKIQTREETTAPIRDALIDQLRGAIAALDENDRTQARFIKRLENRIEQIERRFGARTSGEGRDDVINFEDMGVDFLYVDEAHEFRKLDFVTDHSQVKGITPEGSQRALDLHIKLSWLDGQRPGRSAVLASGTPVTNTLGELYTIQRYMDARELEDSGTEHFDAWAANFGEVVPDYEMNAAGQYELVERFARFVNVPELMKRVRKFMDVLTLRQLSGLLDLPVMEGGKPEIRVVQETPEQKAYREGELKNRIEASRKWKPSKDQPNNPDPLIAIIADARLAAVDMRFIEGGTSRSAATNSKLDEMISEIIKNYHEFKDVEYFNKATGRTDPVRGAAQIVFAVQGFGAGVTRSRGFDAKRYFLRRLTEAGVPASEVAFISDYKTADSKEALFKEMRQGVKKILVGSPKNMGTGVNVQKRLKVSHFLMPPWYPADVEQPDGRIIRQGNQNDEIKIVRYATKGSYDSTGWSMNARKARSIEQAMTGDDSVRSIDDISESSLYEQASAMAAGDERAIKVASLRRDIEVLERLESAHRNEQYSLRGQRTYSENTIGDLARQIAAHEEAITEVGSTYIPGQDFRVTVGAHTPEKRNEMGAALMAAWRRAIKDNRSLVVASDAYKTTPVEIGRAMSKFPVVVELRRYLKSEGSREQLQKLEKANRLEYGVAGQMKVVVGPLSEPVTGDRGFRFVREDKIDDEVDPQGLATRIYNALNSFDSERRELGKRKATGERELKQINSKIGRPFEGEQELYGKVAELAQLQAELAADGVAVPDAGPEAYEWLRSVVGGMDSPSSLRAARTGDKNLEALQSEDFTDLLPRATVTRDGHLLEVNAEGHEILRRAFEQNLIDRGDSGDEPESAFDGTFLNPAQIKDTARTLRMAARRMLDAGYPREEARPLNHFASELSAAGRDGQGTAIAYVYDEAVPHEEFHRAGFMGAASEALASRHAAFTELAAHPAVQKAWDNYFSRVPGYSRLDEALLVEETAAWVAGGKAATLGLSDGEAADYLDRWFESYVEKNGEQSLRTFAQVGLPHVQKIIGQIRGRRADAGGDEAGLQGGRGGLPREQKTAAGEEAAGGGEGAQDGAQAEGREVGSGRYAERALPSTLREQGLRAADELYEIYPDKAATSDAKALLQRLGFDGSIELLKSGSALGAEHVQLSKIIQRALLREASEVAESDPEGAAALRQRQQDLASTLAAQMTRGGQFIRGAQVLDSSAEDVMAAAAKVARERGRELSPEEAARVHRAGEELEQRSAGLEAAALEAAEARRAADLDSELISRAGAGELSPDEVAALEARLAELKTRERERTAEGAKLSDQIRSQRETLSRLREKERRREARIGELDSQMPARRRAERAPSPQRARRRAIEQLAAEERDLVADVMAALGHSPMMMARAEGEPPADTPPVDTVSTDTAPLDGDTLDKLARIGALRLLRAERGKYSVRDFKRDMIADFGGRVRPYLDRVHAEAVRVRRETLRAARREAEVESIAAREGNEDLTRGELEEIAQREREERRRAALVSAEHERQMRRYDKANAGPDAEKEFAKSRAFVRELARRASRVAQRTVGLKDVGSKALAQAIARHAANDIEAIAAAKLATFYTPAEFAREMRDGHGLSPAEIKQAFKDGGRVLEAARADIRKSREMAAALKKTPGASSQERDRALASLQEARRAHARATARTAATLKSLRQNASSRVAGQALRASRSVPMALKASFDAHNLLRQGGIGSVLHPSEFPEFAQATFQGFTAKGFARSQDEIEQSPDYSLYQRMGIDFAFAGKGANAGDEFFEGHEFLDRVPALGSAVRHSHEGFGGGLDRLRMGLADIYIDALRAKGVNYSDAPAAYRSLGEFVNIMTGRPDPDKMGKLLRALYGVMRYVGFGPRFRVSRVQWWTMPFTRVFREAHPAAKRVMLKDWARYMGLAGATLASLVALGWLTKGQVGTTLDPDDPDFLKLRIGRLRLDLTSGAQPELRVMTREMLEAYRTLSGQITRRMGAEAQSDVLLGWLRSGADPRTALFADWWTGEDARGRPFHWWGLDGALATAMMPMSPQGAIETSREYGAAYGAARWAGESVGLGSGVYDDRERPHTTAEKLAARFAAKDDGTRSGEPLDEATKKKLAELKLRARSGEDVRGELAPLVSAGKISDRKADSIASAKGQTLLQEKVRQLSLEDAEHVLKYATPRERASVESIMRAKTLRQAEKSEKDEQAVENPERTRVMRERARARSEKADRKREARYGDTLPAYKSNPQP